MYESHPESKERLRIQSAHLFCCSRSLVEKLPHAVVRRNLSRGRCRDICGYGCADCELRGVIRFLQTDEILGYLTEEASSHVELFCCTTMHVRKLSGRLKPCSVSNSNRASSSILGTARTWHSKFFPVSKNWRSTLLVNVLQMMKTWRMLLWPGWIARKPHGITRVYTKWCEGTNALIWKATMWKGIQRYVPQLVYSVSVLLLKNILVWRSFLYCN